MLQQPGLIDGKLPVFVFPSSITFYSDETSTHKQVVTLYNPYDFSLRFKILSTAPRKYTVVDPEGSIKARCCADIVIRHKEISKNQEGIVDKFRIQVSAVEQKNITGKKDIHCTLQATRDQTQSMDDSFESLSTVSQPSPPSVKETTFTHGNSQTPAVSASPNFLAIIVAALSIIALMLPTDGDRSSHLPTYLHLSFHQKLIAAYILGLVTMALLRS